MLSRFDACGARLPLTIWASLLATNTKTDTAEAVTTATSATKCTSDFTAAMSPAPAAVAAASALHAGWRAAPLFRDWLNDRGKLEDDDDGLDDDDLDGCDDGPLHRLGAVSPGA